MRHAPVPVWTQLQHSAIQQPHTHNFTWSEQPCEVNGVYYFLKSGVQNLLREGVDSVTCLSTDMLSALDLSQDLWPWFQCLPTTLPHTQDCLSSGNPSLSGEIEIPKIWKSDTPGMFLNIRKQTFKHRNMNQTSDFVSLPGYGEALKPQSIKKKKNPTKVFIYILCHGVNVWVPPQIHMLKH